MSNYKKINIQGNTIKGDSIIITGDGNNISNQKTKAVNIYKKLHETIFTNDVLSLAETNSKIKNIINELEKIKLGQEITYNDLKDEFDSLNVPKPSLSLLEFYSNKLSEMIVSGMVSVAVSEPLIELMKLHFKL